MDKPEKNIVVIGGGTGVFTVLSGLKNHSHNLAAVVSMADDGGSTGVLREEFGILPPGDIRRALVALSNLSDHPESLSRLFNYRFEKGEGLEGHTLGNLLLKDFERMSGDFEKAIEEAGKMLRVRGRVIPVTLDHIRLYAELESGEVIAGETNIDVPKHNAELKIKRVFLNPKAIANRRAIDAIHRADLVVVGPGDLYTSIIPNLLVEGIPQALAESRAKKVYVCNLMTKYGETNNFTVSDFVREIERYTRENMFDSVLVNTNFPEERRFAFYFEQEKAQPVMVRTHDSGDETLPLVLGDFLREGDLIRHDPQKLSRAILDILYDYKAN